MTRTLIFTGEAQADLDEIFDFITADNPRRARTYIEDIRQARPRGSTRSGIQ